MTNIVKSRKIRCLRWKNARQSTQTESRFLQVNPPAVGLFGQRGLRLVGPSSLPETFYDPRSLVTEGSTRACLHAKCVVIDDDRALITSANFTEAAHKRNIEACMVITDSILALALRAQFDTLVDHAALQRLPGLHGETEQTDLRIMACRCGRTTEATGLRLQVPRQGRRCQHEAGADWSARRWRR